MKLYQKITTGAMTFVMAASMLITSCTDDIKVGSAFIEKAPGGTQTIDTVFNSAEYTRQFLTGIYALQYYGLPYSSNTGVPTSQNPYYGKLDALTDCYQSHWNQSSIYQAYYSGTLTANQYPLISYTNDLVWQAVRQGWLLIENIDRVPGMDDSEKQNIVAQAKCLIAARYFDLISVYGGLPLIDHSVTGAEGTYDMPRATVDSTVIFMTNLLDEAIPHLRWAYNGTTTDTDATNNTGRWTAASAMALKAKILLFSASPIYNSEQGYYGGTTEAEQKHIVWHGGYDASRWQKALQACQDFFNRLNSEGWYKLTEPSDVNCSRNANGYRQAYRMGYILQGSKEVLHSTRVATVYGSQGTYSWWSWSNPLGSVHRTCYHPTLEYMEMFPWSDGSEFDWESDSLAGRIVTDPKSTSTSPSGRLFYQYRNYRGSISVTPSRDPRLYENLLVSGMTYQFDWTAGTPSGDKYELWVGGYDGQGDAMSATWNQSTQQYDLKLEEKLTRPFATGFGAIKYILGEEFHRKFMHWVYLSLDEMYLMYAECLAQTGNSKAALDQVNIIRSRVGLTKTLQSAYASAHKEGGVAINLEDAKNKDLLIEEILRERACELGMSNNRYYDMIRYKRTDWMTKQLHGLVTFRLIQNSKGEWVRNYEPWKGTHKDNGIIEPYRFDYMRFPLFNRRRVLWDENANSQEAKKWLLFPLPITEVNKGYGLVQNPGWE